jgi:hypothetical protein
MRQQIYSDTYGIEEWDQEHTSRCFVHLANSLAWRQITGSAPPTKPPTARRYTQAGLPWFDYYADAPALKGAEALAGLQSVAELAEAKGVQLLPENDPCRPGNVVRLRTGLAPNQVREGAF